jgi:hypothetical protein
MVALRRRLETAAAAIAATEPPKANRDRAVDAPDD